MSLPPSYNLLAQHPNKYYVETGIYRGDSIQLALDAGCFDEIYACDIDQDCYDFCWHRFDLANPKYDCIDLSCVHSPDFLSVNLPLLTAPATILLDAHWQLTGEKPDNAFPLMDELTAIMESGRENDTIIIDDILYLTHPDITGWKRRDIEQALKRINSRYKIEYIANPVINNMLIAKP